MTHTDGRQEVKESIFAQNNCAFNVFRKLVMTSFQNSQSYKAGTNTLAKSQSGVM